MKKIGNVVIIAGVLLLAYSIVGKFIGGATIGYGIVGISAHAGMTLSACIMIVGLALKSIDSK